MVWRGNPEKGSSMFIATKGGGARTVLLNLSTPVMEKHVCFVFLNFQSARTNTFLKFINIELLEKWSCGIEVSKNSLSISVHCSSRTRKEQVTDCQQAARHTWSSTSLGNGLR